MTFTEIKSLVGRESLQIKKLGYNPKWHFTRILLDNFMYTDALTYVGYFVDIEKRYYTGDMLDGEASKRDEMYRKINNIIVPVLRKGLREYDCDKRRYIYEGLIILVLELEGEEC